MAVRVHEEGQCTRKPVWIWFSKDEWDLKKQGEEKGHFQFRAQKCTCSLVLTGIASLLMAL